MPGGSRLCASRILFLFAVAIAALAGLSLERVAAPQGRGRRGGSPLAPSRGCCPLLAATGATPSRPTRGYAPRRVAAGTTRTAARREADAIADFYTSPHRGSSCAASPSWRFIALFCRAPPARALSSSARRPSRCCSSRGVSFRTRRRRDLPANPVVDFRRRSRRSAGWRSTGTAGLSRHDEAYGIHDIRRQGPALPRRDRARLARIGGKAVQSHVALDDFSRRSSRAG
jgi:hypothetical protein